VLCVREDGGGGRKRATCKFKKSTSSHAPRLRPINQPSTPSYAACRALQLASPPPSQPPIANTLTIHRAHQNSNHAAAPKNGVQELGLALVNQLRNSKDKKYAGLRLAHAAHRGYAPADLLPSGHYIATEFLELPPREDLPDYYEFTKLPIALDTIEDKLKRNAYPTMTTVESDFKRMINNAKSYNDPKSEIYEDAERIRKLVYNYMKQHNPQYAQDPNYTSFPTPIPQTNGHAARETVESGQREVLTRDGEKGRSSAPAVKTSEPLSDRKESVAPSAATGDADGDDGDEDGYAGGDALDFSGMTFQEAQQKMVSFLLNYTDEEYAPLDGANGAVLMLFTGAWRYTRHLAICRPAS
jgi:hypothetical protein